MGVPEIDHLMGKNIDQLVQILRDAPLHPEEGVPPSLDRSEITELQRRLGMGFPPTFAEWLTKTNAPCVGSGGFVGLSPARKSLDIEAIYQNYPSWQSAGWIPVANDGSGNYYVLVPPRFPVAFIDVSENPCGLAYVAASNLLKFIEMFIRRECGERDWPFNEDYVLRNDPDVVTHRDLACMPWES